MKNLDTNAIIEALQNAEKNETQYKALLQSVKRAASNMQAVMKELNQIVADAEEGNLEVKRGRGGSTKGIKRGPRKKKDISNTGNTESI